MNGRTPSSKEQRAASHLVRSIAPFFTRRHQHAIKEIQALPGGLTNKTFLVKTGSRGYIARQAGARSDLFIDRNAESINLQIASELGVAPVIYHTSNSGTLISQLIDQAQTMSSELLKSSVNLSSVVHAMKIIHTSGKQFANHCNVFDRNRTMLEILEKNNTPLPESYHSIISEIDKIEAIILTHTIQLVPCHNDTTPGNFLCSDGKIWMIDWEYSGNNDPLWDLVNLSMEAEFSAEQDELMLKSYYGDQLSDELKTRFSLYKPVVEYWVGLWSLVQISNKNYDNLETLENLEEKRRNNCVALLQNLNQRPTHRLK